MRILFVLHRMHPNLREVENVLASRGHYCAFAVASIGASEPTYVGNRTLLNPSRASKESVSKFIDREKPDLLIQRKFDGPYLEFWRQARERKIPCVLYTQDPFQVPIFDALFRPLRAIRLLRDTVRQRILLGPHTRVTPVRFWGQEGRLAFTDCEYLPFPATIKKSVRAVEPDLPTVITVAKHGQARKRIVWLVRALRQARAPFSLVIVGASPSPTDRRRQRNYGRLLNTIKRLGERARYVVVHEDLSHEEVEALYSSSDLFVLPSKREPMAISPLEAMSHGLPVLASSDGGAASYILPVGSEQIFRTRSYRNFRKKLYKLLQHEDLRKTLSNGNLSYLEHAHSPEVFLSRVMKLAGH